MKENSSDTLQQKPQNQPLDSAVDELNLAEFPLAAISDRFLDGTKTVVLEDTVFDREQNKYLPRRLTLSGSDRYGLPTSKDDDVLLALLDAGIDGFLSKAAGSRIIEVAIGLILAGGRYIPPRLVDLVSSRRTVDVAAALNSSDNVGAARLSRRQIEVLKLMASGRTNKEIARVFNISPATVKAHAMAAFMGLGVSTRAEAVAKAQRLGVIA